MSKTSLLLERARAAAAFDDFGDDSFLEGLEILVASADSQARFNQQGRAMFDATLVDTLTRRLEIERWYALHPEIDAEEIVAPLIGLGLPRTGSTALYCLLAEDPGGRYIRTWEGQTPCPPPEQSTEHNDPRIAETERRLAMGDKLFPRMKAMLPMSATAPTECQFFMAYDFKSQVFLASARVPEYADWLLNRADLVPTYRYVKRVLKLLQWRCPPKRWRLKNPSHSAFIGALDTVFPDARYWMTHRDITKVIPSVVDLFLEMSNAYSDHVDVASIIRENEDWWETALRRLIAFRNAGQERRFFDIDFDAFQCDPLATIEALYEFLGETLTTATRSRMIAWKEATPRERHGPREYDASTAAIDRGALEARFRFYSERFYTRR